jgi:hypothetical protein
MNIKMPDELKELVNELKSDGDFSDISIKIKGNNEWRQKVRNAIVTGQGDAQVILAIKSFYKEKQSIIKELTTA